MLGWFLPGAAQVLGEVGGEAELGVGGDDQPRPPVACFGGADLWGGPAQGLLEQPERVFEVEPAEKSLPEPVHMLREGADA